MANDLKDINAIFNDIINNTQSVAIDAIKKASKQVQEDVCKQAEENLKAYYRSYNPTMYERKNALRRAILPYYADRSSSKSISIEVGVQYNSGALAGAYKSNSWYHKSGGAWVSRNSGNFNFDGSSNGIPESDWILSNFLQGDHPVTKASKSRDGGLKYTYSPVKSESQYSLMKRFFDTVLISKIDGYINAAMENVIIGKFK